MKFKLKDPGSAITHGIAFLLAAAGAAPLLIRSSVWSDHIHVLALSIFILTMMLLYAASTLYHSVDSTDKVNRRLKKLDHMMIFVMIAGSYTPVCLIVLHGKIGYALCALVWATAILGIVFKGFWVMGIFRAVHWHGLAVCSGLRSNYSRTSQGWVWMAACRRYYLHHRRCDLRTEAPHFQRQTQELWIT